MDNNGMNCVDLKESLLDAALPHGRQIVSVVAATILLSILAHGLSASPLAGRYGRWRKAHGG